MNTNQNCEYEKIVNYRNGLSDWMKEYKWEWFCTFNNPNGTSENTDKVLKKWTYTVCIKYNIQICYVGHIINSKITGDHIHLLMSGKNKDGKTLLDMDKSQWEDEWERITHRCSNIQPVYDDGVFVYLNGLKNTPVNHSEMVVPYNTKLLKKYRKISS